MTVALLILILAGDFYYKKEVISKQKSQISRINYELKRKQRLTKLLKLKIDKYKKEIKELQKENKALQMQISDIEDKITFLSDIKFSKLTSNELADIVNELKKYNLKLYSYKKTNHHTDLEIISKFNNSSDIARFMKDLNKLGYKNVTSTIIENKNNIYLTKVNYDE